MRIVAMRNTFTAAGVAGILAIAVAACGGGGSSSTPAAAPAPSSSQPSLPTVNTVNGPTAAMTIVIRIPNATSPVGAVRAPISGPGIRTMANTSPSASIRAATATAYAARIAAAGSSRTPQYISPETYGMELVLASGGSVVYDSEGGCSQSSGTCTGNFTVPIGTNYTVSLFLYDYYGRVLSAGSTPGVNVTTAGPNTVNVTLNGVVSGVSVSVGASNFYQDASSQSSPFNVTVTPYDVWGYTITSPGVAMDNNFLAITSYNMSVTTENSAQNTIADTDLTPATSAPTPDPSTLVATQAYTFTGAGSERYFYFTATPSSGGSPLVANSGQDTYTQTTYGANSTQITDYPVVLTWTNVANYDGPYSSPSDPNWIGSNLVEFPTQNHAGYGFGLSETENGNAVPFGGTVSFANNGCSSVLGSTTSTASYSSLQNSPYVQLALAPVGASTGCYVTATDSANRTANLYIDVDQTSITIQSKTRKH